MPVDDDGDAVLTPAEMRELRTLLLWSFTDLSRRTRIPRSTLCEYETKCGTMKADRQELCRKVLMQAMVAHGARIAKIVGGERAA
ncbi:MAG: hypothetical protein ABSG53_23625 [Thermoguttaceae bacterium]|jgi:hypothetical protein